MSKGSIPSSGLKSDYTMKVKVILELDIPDIDYSEEEIKSGMVEQVVWDETLDCIKSYREESILEFTSLESGSDLSPLHKAFCTASIEHHKKWLEIMKKSVWNFEIL